MRERVISLLLAVAALVAFYGLWLRPTPSLDPNVDTARPTTAERRGNGYAGAFAWLQRSGIEVRSLRERYARLATQNLPTRGNLLVLTLPSLEVFRNDEYAPLDAWLRSGNTLLINAALLDQPSWAVGRSSSAVAEIESLLGVEFESRASLADRLDPTPFSQRVREMDARDREKKAAGSSADETSGQFKDYTPPPKISWRATGPHYLLEKVRTLSIVTDFEPERWSLRMPYDNFALTLARTADHEGALFEQRIGRGRVILVAGGTLFSNRALGLDDNAQLFANIVGASVAPGGAVLFDDLRQGLAASYDPARFYRDPRLYRTLFILLGVWLVWVLGSTRLRAPPIQVNDPSEAELLRRAGGLLARTVPSHRVALAMFEQFFAGVPRAEQWQRLEHHAAVLPQELDQLKSWYADANAERKLKLVPLHNLLDTLGKRLKT